MSIRVKQSTASQEIPLGIFLDETDGKTAETGLTIANTDIKLWKNGATTLANKNSGGATHIAQGIYYCVLDATDTDTLGPMKLFVHVSGALPVIVDLDVVASDMWDLAFGADGAKKLGILGFGTIQSATATSVTLAAASAWANDELIGAVVVITGGTGVGQSRTITDYDSGTDTATVDTWATNPTGTSTYVILAAPPASAASLPDVNVKQISGDSVAADNLEAACDGTSYNLGGGAVVAASVTGEVGSVATGGITAASIATGAIDADAIAAAAVDEIFDEAVDGVATFRQLIRGFASILLGKVSGNGTATITFRDISDTKNRVIVTVDDDHNRTAFTLDMD